jgi:hypothetical protein
VEIDVAQDEPQEPRARRFPALRDRDASLPMLTPAAAVTLDQEDALDEQLLAGVVNL